MVNTVLAHWDESPRLEFRLHDVFPLAAAIGVPKAFEDGEPNWDMLRKKYGDAIYINRGIDGLEWQEISVSMNSDALDDALRNGKPFAFDGYKIDSFTIQAQRKEDVSKFPDFSHIETGIYGFTLTPDGASIIVGTRGGSESVGQIIAAPAGSVGFPPGQIIDPALYAVLVEGHEELGVQSSEWDPLLVGVFRQERGSGAVSNNFFYVGVTKFPGEEIIAQHGEAMDIYNYVKRVCEGTAHQKEYTARRVLAGLAGIYPTFPRDAWENESLMLLPNDADEIVLRATPLVEQGKLKHGMYGALTLYFMDRFEEKLGSLMDIPGFRDQVKINLLT
jgi:hypothetical protein